MGDGRERRGDARRPVHGKRPGDPRSRPARAGVPAPVDRPPRRVRPPPPRRAAAGRGRLDARDPAGDGAIAPPLRDAGPATDARGRRMPPTARPGRSWHDRHDARSRASRPGWTTGRRVPRTTPSTQIVAVVATTPRLRPVLHVGSRPVFRQQARRPPPSSSSRSSARGSCSASRSSTSCRRRRPPTTCSRTIRRHARSSRRRAARRPRRSARSSASSPRTGRSSSRRHAPARRHPGRGAAGHRVGAGRAPADTRTARSRSRAMAAVGELVYATIGDGGTDELQLIVDADAGVTWRLAMGELRDTPTAARVPGHRSRRGQAAPDRRPADAVQRRTRRSRAASGSTRAGRRRSSPSSSASATP